MKTVTRLEFRKNAEGILRRLGRGERFILSHRGHPAARLEPITAARAVDPAKDPFLTIGRRTVPSPRGKNRHADIDRILYGGDSINTDKHFGQASFNPLLAKRSR